MSTIGLWGGPASGKTTYLTSLALSGILYPEDFPWDLRGNDQISTDWLVKTTDMLSSGKFPLATDKKQILHFTVSEIGGQKRQFEFHVIDRPGGDYSTDIEIITKETAKELAGCTGLILLVDFDMSNGNIPQNRDIIHIRQTVENLKSLLKPRGKLPHSLVVVFAKYDDDPLFQWLLSENLIKVKKYKGRITPFVSKPKKAISQTGNGKVLLSIIEKNFEKSRTWYVPVSSIGFANKSDGSLSKNDHSRIIKAKYDAFIKEPESMLPVNVWYPFSLLLNSSSSAQENSFQTNKIPPIIDDDNGNFVADETDDDGHIFEE